MYSIKDKEEVAASKHQWVCRRKFAMTFCKLCGISKSRKTVRQPCPGEQGKTE